VIRNSARGWSLVGAGLNGARHVAWLPTLAAVLCLWWLCADGALAHTAVAEPHDAGDVTGLIADGERSEADETVSDGLESGDVPAAPDDPEADLPPEPDGVTMVGPTDGTAPDMLRFVEPAPDATGTPAPDPITEPAPAQPTEPVSPPEAPLTESIPVASSPAVAPPEPAVLRAPAVAPVPRVADRGPEPASMVAPAPAIVVTGPAAVLTAEPGDVGSRPAGSTSGRDAHVTGGASASAPSRPAPRDAAGDGAVANVLGVAGHTSVGRSAAAGRSAPARGESHLGLGGGLTETALDDIAAAESQVQETISREAPLTATVTLPGGTAPSDSPLERITDYLMYGGTSASGVPPILLAVVAPADSCPGAPSLGGGTVVGAGAGAGAPRPAHAHPLHHPG